MFQTNPKGQWQPPEAGKGAPKEVRAILRKVYSAWRDRHPAEDAETKARGARVAWAAVKKAGWRKGADGKWRKAKAISNQASGPGRGPETDTGVWHMALTQNQREEIITYLTTNCPSWGGEGDAEVLANFADEKLQSLREVAQVAETAVKGFSDANGNAYRVNPATNTWQHQDISKGKAGKAGKAARPTRPTVNEVDVEAEEGECPEGEDCEEMMPAKAAPAPAQPAATNRRKAQTMDDILRSLPPEFQANVQRWQEMELRKKEEIIEEILTNSEVPAADKQAQYDRLIRQTVDELNNTLSLIPKRISKDKAPRVPRRAKAQDAQADDMLTMPTINWGDGGAVNPGSGTVVDNTNLGDEEDDVEYFEALKSLPPRLRARIQNAEAIEGREKARLIDQLTENVVDEELEKRLRQRLATKSVDELRDLLELAPRREANKPAYWGAAGATANQAASGDDILLPQTIDWGKNGTNGSH